MNSLEQLRAGKLAGSRRLNLSCHLEEFPREIFELADTLEILDLSNNALSNLPDDLPKLRHLKILFCSNNRFNHLPKILGDCPQLSMIGFRANQINTIAPTSLPSTLRWLVLTDNQISELPTAIGHCTSLKKLMLAGNQLRSLPLSIANCRQLELLRISANKFSTLPNELFELPNLSWLAFSGNPLSTQTAAPAFIRQINWHELVIKQILGEGASGIIYQAEWRTDNATVPVAVKIFKGQLTSDGLPEHEIAACLRAGTHSNLVSIFGKISNHPNRAEGLVMKLITPHFKNLAAPPSLDSCTRDCYPNDHKFSLATISKIALSIAAAAKHLHANGVMHGDLYAHNILSRDDDGLSLLSDLGAATLFETEDKSFSEQLQRLEVLAFGRLLAELLMRNKSISMSTVVHEFKQLQLRCSNPCPASRPLFAEIENILHRLYADIQT